MSSSSPSYSYSYSYSYSCSYSCSCSYSYSYSDSDSYSDSYSTKSNAERLQYREHAQCQSNRNGQLLGRIHWVGDGQCYWWCASVRVQLARATFGEYCFCEQCVWWRHSHGDCD